MSDLPPQPPAPPEGDPPKPDPIPDDPAILKAELERVRREAARYRTERNDLRPLADKAREMEDANKTEIQKLTEQAAQATAAAEASRLELTRFRVASAKGIPADAVDLLTGTTEDEINAAADRVLSLIASATPPPPPPPGDGDGGPRGTQEQETIDDRIAAAIKAGNHRLAISLNTQKLAAIHAAGT